MSAAGLLLLWFCHVMLSFTLTNIQQHDPIWLHAILAQACFPPSSIREEIFDQAFTSQAVPLCMVAVWCCRCRRRSLVPSVHAARRWHLLALRVLGRTVPRWRSLFARALRLRFKQRCWAYLGHHLNSFGSAQFRARVSKIFPLHR